MSRKFTLIKDYYDNGINLYKKKTIEIEEGLTVLVGCNGIGKTTLLKQIKASLDKENIPCILFNNLNDGGSHAVSAASFHGDFAFMATAMQSSEGENIMLNICKLAEKLKSFIDTGEDSTDKYARIRKIFADYDKKDAEEQEVPNERWLLFDAIDSGLSIDNVMDIKEDLFEIIMRHGRSIGKNIYIIVSANEYEMASGEKCFDVYSGKYVEIDDYDDYRNLVIISREVKERRYQEASDKKEDMEK